MPKTNKTNHTNKTNNKNNSMMPSTPRDRSKTFAKTRRGSPKSPPDAPLRGTNKTTKTKTKPYASLVF